ncbi:MAG: EamA family transporter [Anaerolineaceae bacterium]|nr:EamA family transporter [Anaerolineaceae bacterium]
MAEEQQENSILIKEAEATGQTTPRVGAKQGYPAALLSVAAAALLWSTSYVIIKEAVSEIPPLTFGAIRFMIAAVVVVILALLTGRVEKVSRSDLLRLAVGGLLGITLYFSLQNVGVQKASASDATLLVASFPAITMLLETILFKKKSSIIRFAGVGIAFVGIYFIIDQSGPSAGSQRLQGDLLFLSTGVVWAFYNFVTQNIVQRYSTLTVIFWQTLFGAIAFIPVAFLEAAAWAPISAAGLLSALYLGGFCSVGAFLFYGYGLRKLDPGTAVALLNLVPVFGLILAITVLKEKVGLIQIVGGLIVIAGVTLTVPVDSHNNPFQKLIARYFKK